MPNREPDQHAQPLDALLGAVPFDDPAAARKRLERLVAQTEAQTARRVQALLLRALASISAPDHVLIGFERLVAGVADKDRWLERLAQHPRTLETLATLFSGSQFLSEILLRQPEAVAELADPKRLATVWSASRFADSTQATLTQAKDYDTGLNALRRWQRDHLLRIGTCDLLGLLDLATVTGQLSLLAEAAVAACLKLAAEATHTDETGFAVLALGKLGGGELNYSSDIDLLFVSRAEDSRHEPLGRRLIDAVSRITAQGFLYRVDMRLRPWGQSGPLVASFDGYLNYTSRHARFWEKQALLKARPVAGDRALGAALLDQLRSMLATGSVEHTRQAVRELKQRTETWLRQQGRDWGEVKLGEGSIRDVEFVAQFLQLVHAQKHPEVLTPNTQTALSRLRHHGLLSPADHRVLYEGYTFLRTIEHHLQMMHHQQTHQLPDEAGALERLARRLGFSRADGTDGLLAHYGQHRDAIRRVYQHHLAPPNTQVAIESDAVATRHRGRMHARYAEVFSARQIAQHAELVNTLDRNRLIEVNAVPQEDDSWQVTIVGFDHPGELSLICGLFVVHGLDVQSGHVFTYEPAAPGDVPALSAGLPRWQRFDSADHPALDALPKIVDVFTVRALRGLSKTIWKDYAGELAGLVGLMLAGKATQAHNQLIQRLAAALGGRPLGPARLYPVDIEVDNVGSKRYTVLRIGSMDTPGFLFELTNALALGGVYIGRMEVSAQGQWVQDTLYVSNNQGRKIIEPQAQHALRTATVLVKHFTHLLPSAPNPASALMHFRQLLKQLMADPQWAGELVTLERPEVLGALARLLGVSDFLWDDFLRMQHAQLLPVVTEGLAQSRTRNELEHALQRMLAQEERAEAKADCLNAFKDREMFRIDMRHILGHIQDFESFSHKLTDLAEVVVEAALALVWQEVARTHGQPQLASGAPCPLGVLALGKCGGRELGFASDVELIFVYADNGATSGPHALSNAEFFERVVALFLKTIRARHEGVFEIDLQLRPYGQAGSLAVPLEGFARYFAAEGPAWPYERQALVRLRPIAGDLDFGQRVVAVRDTLIYTGQAVDLAALRAMRERQLRHLVAAGTFNAKFSAGGLVDVEYLVQVLQLTHGGQHPKTRQSNTLAALDALKEAGALSEVQHGALRAAHRFLRRLIDALRVVRGHAKDLTVPPAGSEEFLFLARRLGTQSPEAVQRELAEHTARVQAIVQGVLFGHAH